MPTLFQAAPTVRKTVKLPNPSGNQENTMQFNLKTTVPSQSPPDSDYLETFRFPNGRAFPVSYRLFAEQYG